MTGLWKVWKAKKRLPTLPTSPLEISPRNRRDSHIPTAPATEADGKVENQKQVSHFPTASISLSLKNKTARRVGFALRPRRRFSPPQWSPFAPPWWETFTPPLTPTTRSAHR